MFFASSLTLSYTSFAFPKASSRTFWALSMIDFPDFSMFWNTSASVMTRADANGNNGTTREKRILWNGELYRRMQNGRRKKMKCPAQRLNVRQVDYNTTAWRWYWRGGFDHVTREYADDTTDEEVSIRYTFMNTTKRANTYSRQFYKTLSRHCDSSCSITEAARLQLYAYTQRGGASNDDVCG
jgi:hypothetical protein